MAHPGRLADQLLAKGEARLRAALSENGYSTAEQDEAVAGIRAMPVLRLLALSGARSSTEASPAELSPGADPEAVRRLLGEVAEQHGFSDDDVEAAARLIRDGVLADDLAGVTSATERALGRVPESVLQYLNRPAEAGSTVLDVLRNLPDLLGGVLTHIRGVLRGDRPRDPVGREALAALYSIQAVDVVRDWLVDVSAYESIQLAIIAYAKTQGWRVDRQNIEGLRRTLADDDLSPALVEGVRFFESTEHGRFLTVVRDASRA